MPLTPAVPDMTIMNKTARGNGRPFPLPFRKDGAAEDGCFRGAVFDMDGTILDSMGMWQDIDRRYLSRFGKEAPADLQRRIEGFSVPEEDCLEADIHNMDEVSAVSERARQFCLDHGQSQRVANHVSLCVEEKASNTIEHGFRDGAKNHLSLRILFRKDYWVLRFRDDCGQFDPVSYMPAKEDAGKGGMKVTNVNEIVNEVFEVTGFSDILTIE